MIQLGRSLYVSLYMATIWRTLLNAHNEYKRVKEVKGGIRKYIKQYNCKRLHQSLEYNTPHEIYAGLKELSIKVRCWVSAYLKRFVSNFKIFVFAG